MFDFDHDYDYEATVAKHGGPMSAREIKWGNRFATSWDKLAAQADILPQYIEQARDLIVTYLGYRVSPLVTLCHEPFIRALIEQNRQGFLTGTAFKDAVTMNVKHVRNDDMQRNGWANPYTEADYHKYDTYLKRFKGRARNRLVQNLGFEPSLDYSLDAELMLRVQYASPDFSEYEHTHTGTDCKAYTIVFYRMVLAEDGREGANDLDLMGLV